jgi:hypothetical protein
VLALIPALIVFTDRMTPYLPSRHWPQVAMAPDSRPVHLGQTRMFHPANLTEDTSCFCYDENLNLNCLPRRTERGYPGTGTWTALLIVCPFSDSPRKVLCTHMCVVYELCY